MSWTDTIGGLLGGAIPAMRPEYRDVTFIHRLSHRSGLPGDEAGGDPKKLAERILSLPPAGPKETTFVYSNAGYNLIAPMLETRMGEPWPGLIRRHLFEPLGLVSARFNPSGSRTSRDQPWGHFADGRLGYASSPSDGPAGGAYMTTTDMIRYLSAHRDKSSLLTSESWRVLHTPPFGGEYAMGWVLNDGKLWHTGGNGGWKSSVLVDTKYGVAAASVCNQPIEALPFQMMMRAHADALAS